MYASQVFGSKLVLVSGQHDAVELGIRKTHAEVQNEVVVGNFQDLDNPAEETVHLVHSWKQIKNKKVEK